jgi:hypothetical protein
MVVLVPEKMMYVKARNDADVGKEKHTDGTRSG